jgi:hypothetical protein
VTRSIRLFHIGSWSVWLNPYSHLYWRHFALECGTDRDGIYYEREYTFSQLGPLTIHHTTKTTETRSEP